MAINFILCVVIMIILIRLIGVWLEEKIGEDK